MVLEPFVDRPRSDADHPLRHMCDRQSLERHPLASEESNKLALAEVAMVVAVRVEPLNAPETVSLCDLPTHKQPIQPLQPIAKTVAIVHHAEHTSPGAEHASDLGNDRLSILTVVNDAPRVNEIERGIGEVHVLGVHAPHIDGEA